jgi:hypothetical protein
MALAGVFIAYVAILLITLYFLGCLYARSIKMSALTAASPTAYVCILRSGASRKSTPITVKNPNATRQISETNPALTDTIPNTFENINTKTVSANVKNRDTRKDKKNKLISLKPSNPVQSLTNELITIVNTKVTGAPKLDIMAAAKSLLLGISNLP